jgi:hypothetical protein
MFTNKFAWSFSAADLYEQCPEKYHREKVKKDIPYTQNDAAKRGEDVHHYLEYGVSSGSKREKLPDYGNIEALDNWMAKVRGLKNRGYKVGTETKMTLNKALQPVDWFAKDAWLRTIIDLWYHDPDMRVLYVFDYKTGRFKTTGQLELTAAVAAYYFKDQFDFDKVNCTFMFLDQPPEPGEKFFCRLYKETFETKKRTNIIKSWLPTLQSIDNDMSTGEWEKKSSWLCRYCDVKDCEYNKKE